MITSRVPIRVSAPILLVAPVLLVAGVLIAVHTVQGRAAVDRLASQQLAQIHDQIAQHVDDLVGLPSRVDRVNVALLRSGRLEPDALRDWAPLLIEQFRAFDALSAITWGGADGQCTWIARYIGDDEHLYYAIKDGSTGDTILEYRVDAQDRIAAEPAGAFTFDPRERPWYTAPRDAGRPAWSEPFLWVGGSDAESATLGIAYGWPCYADDGALIGVMDADLSLQDISRFLSGLEIGQKGRAYLVDHAGLMLAASTRAPLADDAGGRLGASDSPEAWIAASAEHLRATFGDLGALSRAHQGTIEVGGTREWVRASPFVHDSGLHWVIVTVVPESDFMSEITAGRRRSAWIAAGVTAATLGLGVLLAMFMVRPILVLSAHARRLGEGDLDQEVHLGEARELVRLSDDMNQMADDLRDRMELRRSLALAMEVQQSLLPEETPAIDGLDISGHSTYCDETGGDYYDYLDIAELTPGAVAVVVGDVVGHGIAAAMLMATARGILRSRCLESGSLGELLGHLNDMLVEVTGGTRFMTMVLLAIDRKRMQLRLSSAGHDMPFIYDPASDTFAELKGGSLPLGILPDEEYPETTFDRLRVGSVVVVSTDGVWEAQNEAGQQFGKDRFCDIIRANAGRRAREIAAAVRTALEDFTGEARQLDDITFVVIRCVEARGEPPTGQAAPTEPPTPAGAGPRAPFND